MVCDIELAWSPSEGFNAYLAHRSAWSLRGGEHMEEKKDKQDPNKKEQEPAYYEVETPLGRKVEFFDPLVGIKEEKPRRPKRKKKPKR